MAAEGLLELEQAVSDWEKSDVPYVVEDVVVPEYDDPKATIDERFEFFHAQNPHVYAMIVRIARALKDRGMKVASMELIFSRMRWLYALRTQGDPFKLNDHYTALYSRLAMNENEDLGHFFRCRKRRTRGAQTP